MPRRGSPSQKRGPFPLPAQAGECFSGDHGEKVTPVPIPNTAVKGLIGEGTAGVARGRVARCRDLFQGPVRRKSDGALFRLFVYSFVRLLVSREEAFIFAFMSLMLSWSFCQ